MSERPKITALQKQVFDNPELFRQWLNRLVAAFNDSQEMGVASGRFDDATSPGFTDKAIARYHGTDGALQNSTVIVRDNGRLQIPAGAGIGIGVVPTYALHIVESTTVEGRVVSTDAVPARFTLKNTLGEWKLECRSDAGKFAVYDQVALTIPFKIDPACPDNSLKLTPTGIEVAGNITMAASKTVDGVDVSALDAAAVKDGEAAGGSLTGTWPNPTLAAAAVDALTEIAAALKQGDGTKLQTVTTVSTNKVAKTDSGGKLVDAAITADGTTVQVDTVLALASETPTITSGAVTLAKSYAVLSAESGTSDDLDTLTLPSIGSVATIRGATGHTITVKDGTGNILCGADIVLTGSQGDSATFLRIGASVICIAQNQN